MATSGGWDWVFWALAITLALLALALLAWSLFWDRARGRKRCPKCWYDMSAPATDGDQLTCPECGRTTKTAAHLTRTRRRWRFAALALVLALGAAVSAGWPRAQQRGWLSFVPTPVVIELLPIGGLDGPFGTALLRRMYSAPLPSGDYETTITDADRLRMVRRIAEGNILARPVSERWRRSFGELHRYDSKIGVTLPGGDGYVEECAEAAKAWLEIPVDLTVRTRDKWPRDAMIVIETDLRHYWPRMYGDMAQMRWSALETEESNEGRFRGGFSLEPGTAPGGIELEIDVRAVPFSVETRTRDYERAETVHTESFRVEYEFVDDISDVMTPVATEELDTLLETSLTVSYRDRSGLLFDTMKTRDLLPEGLGVGLRGEILHNGEPIGYHAIGSFGPKSYGVYREYYERERNPTQYMSDNKDSGQWTIRITPEPEWALRQLDCDKYWKGEIELPLEFEEPLRRP